MAASHQIEHVASLLNIFEGHHLSGGSAGIKLVPYFHTSHKQEKPPGKVEENGEQERNSAWPREDSNGSEHVLTLGARGKGC
jgi:hypothetical protein